LSIFYYISTKVRHETRVSVGWEHTSGGLCATNLPRVISEKEFSRVFPAFRETGRGTNEFERLPKRRSPLRSHHVSLRSLRRGAGKRVPNARNKRARDRKRALQVVIIRGPGADSHVVRSRRTALRLPPPPSV